MKNNRLVRMGLACAVAAVFTVQVRGDTAEEVKRLAEVMGWKAGTVAADIGAGDGKYTFAAVERVGAAGKVYATEIDAKKLAELKDEAARRKLANVIVVESKEAETNLPAACCDAIFLRHVYHHLTKPVEFNASLVRSGAVVEERRAAGDYRFRAAVGAGTCRRSSEQPGRARHPAENHDRGADLRGVAGGKNSE